MVASIIALALGALSGLIALGFSADIQCKNEICAAASHAGFLEVVMAGGAWRHSWDAQ
jgi:hypothetical protein